MGIEVNVTVFKWAHQICVWRTVRHSDVEKLFTVGAPLNAPANQFLSELTTAACANLVSRSLANIAKWFHEGSSRAG